MHDYREKVQIMFHPAQRPRETVFVANKKKTPELALQNRFYHCGKSPPQLYLRNH